MRHNKTKKTLDRKAGPRRALLRGLATNLVLYEKIITNPTRAKLIRSKVEKYITKGKKNTLHALRELNKYFYGDNAVRKILEVLSPRYLERPGGYLRIVKLSPRKGDAAERVRIMFV